MYMESIYYITWCINYFIPYYSLKLSEEGVTQEKLFGLHMI